MLLAIDVGNTNIVIGCIGESGISKVFRMLSDLSKTEDEYAIGIKQILEFNGFDCSKFDGAIISTVVPPLLEVLKSAIKRLTGLDALVVGAGLKTGMNIVLDDPGELAGDLVASSVAALETYKPPIIIFDMGTATTIVAIDKNGRYLGGAIFPGIALSMNVLARGTSLLPKVQIEAPERAIGSNTIDAMKSGAVFGTASMMDGMITKMEKEFGEPASVVATGGLASRFIDYCEHEVVYDENLLLRGLGILYNKNKKSK